jgi:hypothetical protein
VIDAPRDRLARPDVVVAARQILEREDPMAGPHQM